MKLRLLHFGKKFGNFSFLDNNQYPTTSEYECIAGIGSLEIFSPDDHSFSAIDEWLSNKKDWIFGHLNYDLKNEFENLVSENEDSIRFPLFTFFIPKIVVLVNKNECSIGAMDNIDPQQVFTEIQNANIEENPGEKVSLKTRFTKEEYLQTVLRLQAHLQAGDCYEICLCQEFYKEHIKLAPIQVFQRLNQLSPNPFAAFYKSGHSYLMSSSPERFLRKSGKQIISQPIKGTLKRNSLNDSEIEREQLLNDPKERAENTMIVDLVRNDLSKICTKGSVHVMEYLGVYTFPKVHQMISTIGGALDKDKKFSEIIKATFPMGSMTGAPKIKAMELIDIYERTKRGLFSGSVGYFTPEGNFDFNVVIRSVLYNEQSKYCSVQTGSAITLKSNPEAEYNECLVKLEAMEKVLG